MTNDEDGTGAGVASLPQAQREDRAELGSAKTRGMMENLGVVSHELRNSVGVLRNATRVIETSPCDLPLVTKARQLIEARLTRWKADR